MTIAYACVLFMGLFPYVAAGIAKKDLIITTTACQDSGWLNKPDLEQEPMLRKQTFLSPYHSSLLRSSLPALTTHPKLELIY